MAKNLSNTVVGTAVIGDETFPVAKASLELWRIKSGEEISFELHLEAGDGQANGKIIRIDGIPVANAKKLHDLIGAKVHFETTSEAAEDDSIGSNPSELIETSGWFLGEASERTWFFDSMEMALHHRGGWQFDIEMKCILRNWKNLDSFAEGAARFTVTAKQKRKTKAEKEINRTTAQDVRAYIESVPLPDRDRATQLVGAAFAATIMRELELKGGLSEQRLVEAAQYAEKLGSAIDADPVDLVRAYWAADWLYNEIVGMLQVSDLWWSIRRLRWLCYDEGTN